MRSHILTYAAGRGLGLIAQVATVVVLSRLGGDLYLEYSLVLAVVIFTSNLFVGWYRQALLRDSKAGDSGIRAALAAYPIVGIALTGVVSVPLTAVFVPLVGFDFLAILIFAAGYAIHVLLLTDAQRTLRPTHSVAIESLRLATTAFLPLLVHIAGLPVDLVVVLLCGSATTFLIFVRAAWRSDARPIRDPLNDLKFGASMAVWLALASALQFSDRFILQMQVGVKEAAQYAASYDIVARGASGLLMPILMAAHPLIMAAHNTKSEAEARALTRRAFYWCLGAGMAVLAGSVIFSAVGGELVPTADTSLPVVVFLAMGGVAWQLALVVHKEFELTRKVVPLVIALALSVTVNVTVNLFLASRSGNVGVAAANLGAVLLYMAIIRAEQIRRRRVSSYA